MPVEHAEGKVVTADEATHAELDRRGQLAVRYVDTDGGYDRYPANPNGSVAGIAGLCDPTGRIFGLMPHPDRHFDHTHHPLWTRRRSEGPPDGLTIFHFFQLSSPCDIRSLQTLGIFLQPMVDMLL